MTRMKKTFFFNTMMIAEKIYSLLIDCQFNAMKIFLLAFAKDMYYMYYREREREYKTRELIRLIADKNLYFIFNKREKLFMLEQRMNGKSYDDDDEDVENYKCGHDTHTLAHNITKRENSFSRQQKQKENDDLKELSTKKG
jgi:hypothetical protein